MHLQDYIAVLCISAVTGFAFAMGCIAIYYVAKTSDPWQEKEQVENAQEQEHHEIPEIAWYVDQFGNIHQCVANPE
jgi:S-adenosylmethionine hydrolase